MRRLLKNLAKHILNECAFLYEIERPIIKGT